MRGDGAAPPRRHRGLASPGAAAREGAAQTGRKPGLNGGIIATVLDCHGVSTAIADAHQQEGRAIGSEPEIWCATASMTVDYLRPTPLGVPLELRSTVVTRDDRRTSVDCVLEADGKERARARVVAVRVPAEWKHGGTR